MANKLSPFSFAPEKLTIAPSPRSRDNLTVLTLDQVDELERLQRRVLMRSGTINSVLEYELNLGTGVVDGPLVGDISILEAVQEMLDDINEAAAGIAKVLKTATRHRHKAAAKGGA